MLRLNLLTGTAWTKSIIVDGDEKSDLVKAIDDYFEEHGAENFPVPLYKSEEMTDEELDMFIPINGGEYYIEGISSIESFESSNSM